MQLTFDATLSATGSDLFLPQPVPDAAGFGAACAGIPPLSDNKRLSLALAAEPRRGRLALPSGAQLTVAQIRSVAAYYQTRRGIAITVNRPADSAATPPTAMIAALQARAVREKAFLGGTCTFLKDGPCLTPVPRDEMGHTEALICTPRGDVLNIVPFEQGRRLNAVLMQAGHHVAASDIGILPKPDPAHGGAAEQIVVPQMSRAECASFGLAVLKEYLKDDAGQLRRHTLIVRAHERPDDTAMPQDFLLPSPHVLRYSQNAFYNKIMAAIVAGSDPSVAVSDQGRVKVVPTLSGLLRNGVIRTVEGQELDAAALAAFRAEWLAVAQNSAQPRWLAMHVEEGGAPRSKYLFHLARRHQVISGAESDPF